MINEDTIKLLKECNAGVKMGVSSLDEVIEQAKSRELKKMLLDCKEEHEKLGEETREILNKNEYSGKEPNVVAKGMSWIKTNLQLVINESDNTIADLITDGCNMGVKSLNKYLNQYKSAEDKVKDIAKRLINIEEKLVIDLRPYL